MLWKTLKITAATTMIPLALAGCHGFSKSPIEKQGIPDIRSAPSSSPKTSSEPSLNSDTALPDTDSGDSGITGSPLASPESSAKTEGPQDAAGTPSALPSVASTPAVDALPSDALPSDALESHSSETSPQAPATLGLVSFQLSDTAPSSDDDPGDVSTPTSMVQQASSTEESLLTSAAKRTVDLVRSAIPLPGELERNRLAKEISEFEKFDFAFELPTVAGEQVSSKSFGGQLFVIDIWATWCGPCKRGIPELIELQQEFESHGIQVIGITCDSPDGEDSQEVARRAYNIGEQLKVNYPLLVDDGTTIPQIPGFRSYPTTLFMTPDGRVRYMVSGLQSKAKLEMMIKTLLEL